MIKLTSCGGNSKRCDGPKMIQHILQRGKPFNIMSGDIGLYLYIDNEMHYVWTHVGNFKIGVPKSYYIAGPNRWDKFPPKPSQWLVEYKG